jgi:DNA-binding PadR family transcriptional regulator
MMFEHPPRPFKRWIRHTASVPKGFLRYYVLKLLREKPMSGSEIMEEIKKETDGRWKPSPGSVYPLLAWLQDNGYTEETPTEESGIKRYMLTKKGEKFFEEQTKLGERLRKKLEFLAPLLVGGFWFGPHSEKLREIREPVRRFAGALFNLGKALQENLTEQALKEVGDFLNNTAEKIEEINKRLKEGN